jgi:thiol:disulfide interchange protein DsbD
MIVAVAAAILSLALVIGWAQAQAPPEPTSIVSITSAVLVHPLTADGSSTLNVSVSIAPGWHINSDHPSSPYYIPTRLTLVAPAGVTVGAVEYPPAEAVTPRFAAGERLAVFTGTIALRAQLRADARFRSGVGAPLKLRIDYQACNDEQCLRPVSVKSKVDLAAPVAAIEQEGDAAAPPGLGEDTYVARIFARHGYILGFLAVLIGGLALNLTPCVYPLIGVTIAYFGYEGASPRSVVWLAVLYVLGIALMFSTVGVAVALSGGLFGAALQNPYVIGAVAAMLLVLAASSFGLFVLQPPQWMMRRAGVARHGYLGALVMGLGMGVVAAPCIGPIVLGLLLMVQRSRSPLFGFALFFTLAIGLGAPYIGLALAAGNIKRLPRSGEWLRWVEQLFGFVLMGLALYFLDPIIPGRLATRILPFYAAGAGIFLGFITPEGRNWRPFMILRSIVGIAAIAGLVYLLIPAPMPPHQLPFAPFTRATLDAARAQGKPVVLDFSADWCVPCREMERTTFVDPAVVRQAAGFVRMRADLTAENPSNAALMKEFRIEGVPTTVFIDARGQIRKRRVGYVGPGEFLKYLREFG